MGEEGKQQPGLGTEDIWRTSSFRVALPQVLATLGQSLLLLSLGMMIAVSTIVIGALLNAPTGLSLDDNQSSWFAGVMLAIQPLGSVLSGGLSEALGRKKCMMFVAVPQLAGWLLLYYSQTVAMLYLSGLMLGFSMGFMEAPGLSYVGEVVQPRLRANMCSVNSLNVPIGFLVMYLLGTIFPWRTAVLCSTVMPVIIVLAIIQIPESPLWLLRKGRTAEAEAALCWLRGWVGPEEVRAELNAMKAYSDRSQHPKTSTPRRGQVYIEVPRNGNSPRLAEPQPRPLSLWEKLKDLARPEMMRPLLLVVFIFFFYHAGALTGLRPYMLKTFKNFRLTVDPYWLSVASALLQISGAVCCVLLIHRLGKRLLSLVSLSMCSACVLSLGAYALLAEKHGLHKPVVPLGLFAALFFFTNFGIAVVPWVLISEVFPPRGRSVAGGIASAIYYINFFLVSKTFLNVQNLLGLYGLFFVSGAVGLVGVVYIYCCLPETEGKTQEEIEKFFTNKPTVAAPIN